MKLLALAVLFVRELLVSAARVAWLAVQPGLTLRPAVVAYPLTVPSDAEIALLANLVTLTPGTLSIDVSDDRKWLTIHCLDSPGDEQVIDSISGGFETRILQVFR
jgi:multicomponent Na+:H+ antiporter subunit E